MELSTRFVSDDERMSREDKRRLHAQYQQDHLEGTLANGIAQNRHNRTHEPAHCDDK